MTMLMQRLASSRSVATTTRRLALRSASFASSTFTNGDKKNAAQPGRVVVITSGKGGVGKTTVTASIGYGLAQRGFRTCLIDFDIGLRNLDLHLVRRCSSLGAEGSTDHLWIHLS